MLLFWSPLELVFWFSKIFVIWREFHALLWNCEFRRGFNVSRYIFVISLHRFFHSHEILIYDAFLDEIMWDKERGQVESACLCLSHCTRGCCSRCCRQLRPFSMPLVFPVYFCTAFYHGLKRCFELIRARSQAAASCYIKLSRIIYAGLLDPFQMNLLTRWLMKSAYYFSHSNWPFHFPTITPVVFLSF